MVRFQGQKHSTLKFHEVANPNNPMLLTRKPLKQPWRGECVHVYASRIQTECCVGLNQQDIIGSHSGLFCSGLCSFISHAYVEM
jgi:hypothetical protein